MKYNWKPVIEDAIKCLLDQGLTLSSVDNGDEEEIPVSTIDEAVEQINATDESNLYMENPDGRLRSILIVLGNEPCELFADYTCDPLIDNACDKFYELWDGRKCPENEDYEYEKELKEVDDYKTLKRCQD